MAVRRNILFFLFILTIFVSGRSANAQEKQTVTFSDHLSWNDSAEYPVLPFRGSGYYDEESGIPVYTSSFPMPENFNLSGSIIDSVEFFPGKWVSVSKGNYLTDITGNDLTNSFSYKIVTIRKKAYLEVEIIPYKQSTEPNNGWKKLIQYTVKVSFSPKKSAELKAASDRYASNSVLSSGKWVKTGSSRRGIHKISYETLQQWGFTNPSKVQVFGNGGAMVPINNSEERPDDLPPIGTLHTGNALFFYSPGTWNWIYDPGSEMFNFRNHQFSPMAFFFLSEVSGTVRTPEQQQSPAGTTTATTQSYDALYFHALENENILNSGNQWLGEKFNSTIAMSRNFEVEIPNLITGEEALFHTQVAGRSNSSQAFDIQIGESAEQTVYINTVSLSDYLGYYLRLATGNHTFLPESSKFNINYTYSNASTTSIGWLDYFIINGRGHLSMENGSFDFRDQSVVIPGGIVNYEIAQASGSDLVWNISNPLVPLQMETEIENGTLHFTARADEIKEYVAFNPSQNFPQPEFIGNVENQNLHATTPAEMVIVAPPEFMGQAGRLANLHKQHSELTVTIANRDQIYNEFSWGHPDPGAIRAFLKMLYDRAGDNVAISPKLLLLFGDGTYDNRHLNNTPAAPLPTYQSDNSIYQTSTFVTDDFFGFLDDDEGDDLRNDRLDIGIGRFPVTSIEQAVTAVDKSEAYLQNQDNGKWKTKLTFVGDDGDYNIHVRDADRLTQKISANHKQFDLNKIYFDAFPMTTGAVGKEFPEAKTRTMQAITEGTLIFNYTGHGSENNLAHEKLITRTDIKNWNNKSRLPLFITATCEFSRFDNHNHTSAGEEVFLHPNGGGIALLSTTRIVYSSLNFTLNNAFYNHAFEKDENGLPLRFGEMMRRTKLESGANTNKLNFTLLGDPALRLIYPANEVATASLNNIEVFDQPDTLRALTKNRITGIIKNTDGEHINNFSGNVSVTVYDKAVNTRTLGNGGNEPFEFKEFSNILFKGEATVTNGNFSLEFVIPKDIRYNFDNGRISYYAISDDGTEAAGAFSDVVIGGISENPDADNQGPQVNLYLNHPGFASGQTTGSRPILYAEIFDESGINTSGIGIGHNITLIIDEDTNNPLVLNDAFTADTDQYQKGTLQFQLPLLENGTHNLTLKVWDNYNNSSTATLSFNVNPSHGMNIRNFSVWPNPVAPGQEVYLNMQTDVPNALLKATIQFIDSGGKVTGTVEDEIISTGNVIGPYKLPMEKSGWNYSQICFVRIILTPQNGEESQVVAKLLPAP
ncbi:type IX secretion system sortase PorU [Marinilabilia salmonicolor]|uniref:type IX secretion system sortase PorU n=2 Tax=Marinilabilia salmonicolor TaxID=989 RepID=UPI00029B3BA9|nr:type IX secretion system sortase PorU [Marinilabilia salmonicolor]